MLWNQKKISDFSNFENPIRLCFMWKTVNQSFKIILNFYAY